MSSSSPFNPTAALKLPTAILVLPPAAIKLELRIGTSAGPGRALNRRLVFWPNAASCSGTRDEAKLGSGSPVRSSFNCDARSRAKLELRIGTSAGAGRALNRRLVFRPSAAACSGMCDEVKLESGSPLRSSLNCDARSRAKEKSSSSSESSSRSAELSSASEECGDRGASSSKIDASGARSRTTDGSRGEVVCATKSIGAALCAGDSDIDTNLVDIRGRRAQGR
ncbi:hypothetical protein B0H12DRAFT_793209 [Mycena haematopus]|nr:hypothetical protein B0H12DRAFT_793209 [Mycena haematopus]